MTTTKASNFWIQVTLAVILAAALLAATVTATPTAAIDRATNAAGTAGEVLVGEGDPADEQARVCWFRC